MTVRFDASSIVAVDALVRDLYKLPDDQREALKGRFTSLAQPMLADARSRASWSQRIPGAIGVQSSTSLVTGRVGVVLRVSARKAPHARVYEGIGGASTFRHPVFADASKPRTSWTWTEKNSNTRPFAFPAVRANEGRAQAACIAAVEDAARKHGFR